jgi:hypothetical protein
VNQESVNDIQKLITYCRSAAETLLIEQDEFYPFAAYINNDTNLIPANFYDGDEFPTSDTIIRHTNEYFKKRISLSDIRGFAIAYNTRVKNERYSEFIDAVCIKISHRLNGENISYYLPYKLDQKKIQFYDSWMEDE